MPQVKAPGKRTRSKGRYRYFIPKAQASKVGEQSLFVKKIGLLEKEFGGAKLARFAGVDRSRITRWKQGAKADPANQDRINGLEYIVSCLHGFLAPESQEKWLFGINAHLNNCRPIDLIENGRIAEVIAAIEQAKLCSYA